MTITSDGNTLQIGKDFVSAVTGPYRTKGELELLPSGERYEVLSCLNASDTSDTLIRAMRKEGVRGNITTQAISNHPCQSIQTPQTP